MMVARQPLVGTTIASQLTIKTMAVSQSLKEITTIVKLIDLLVMVWSTLESQKNRKNYPSPKNRLSQEKICQKVGIHLISIFKILGRAF